MPKIQRVELNKHYHASIHCPFCGQLVVKTDFEDDEELVPVNPCPHTLFMAHDEGFEYRSDRFDKNLSLSGVEDDDVETEDKGYDGLTDEVSIADSIKFASYVGAPSFFGSYVGFAPLESD